MSTPTAPHTPSSGLVVHTDLGDLTLPEGSTVADVVALLTQRAAASAPSAPCDSAATALNGRFVPRHQRAHHPVRDGDTVLCFSPITGG